MVKYPKNEFIYILIGLNIYHNSNQFYYQKTLYTILVCLKNDKLKYTINSPK